MNFKLLLAVLLVIAAPTSMGQVTLIDSSTDTDGIPMAKDENGTVETTIGEEKDLKGRMERIESKSRHHEKEIEVLKTLLEEEKKFSKGLSGRILQLEGSANPSSIEDDQPLSRPKRPYRLLPPHAPLEKDNKGEERNQQIYGPASNCDELGMIGYTLNGYYLVRKATDSTKKGKIGIVYCQFQQLHGQKQIAISSDLRTLMDLENSELDLKIIDHVSQKLMPIDSKIMEQTKQIKDIFELLEKQHDDKSLLSVTSKKEELKSSRGNPSQSVASTTQSPTLKTSTASFSTLKIKTSSDVIGLIWQEGSAGLKWAHSCDYGGFDINITQSSTPEQCGQNCVNSNRCSHFTWNSGACYLKHFKSTVSPTDHTICVSGWIKRNNAQTQFSLSSTCFYYVDNRPDLIKLSWSTTSEDCRNRCINKEQCAHFAWLPGRCYQMLSSDSTKAVDLKKTACGWIRDRVLKRE